ncbi:response regulator [candidate division KSB1 bacterium]
MEDTASKILLVDDSQTIVTMLRRKIESELGLPIDAAYTFAETKELVEQNSSEYLLALLDLNLPDAPDGEVVDFMLSQRIPSVILTGSFDENAQKKMWDKGILDYVIKENVHTRDYITSLIDRIIKNKSIKTLVVDDSSTSRKYISSLLKIYQFHVIEAANGAEALELLEENPDIKLVVTDYNMPKMDGFQLIKHIRNKFDKNKLAVIGLSGEATHALSAQFIKNGANDFLKKPFNREEFYCRISQNIAMVEHIDTMEYTEQKLRKEIHERKKIQQELLTKSQKVKNLLDNAGEGFLMFGRDLKIENEYSEECRRIFGTNIENEVFPELISPNDSDQKQFIESVLHEIFLDTDQVKSDALIRLLPEEAEVKDRNIHIEYKPVTGTAAGSKLKLMTILSDITEKRGLENKMERERNKLRMVVCVRRSVILGHGHGRHEDFTGIEQF